MTTNPRTTTNAGIDYIDHGVTDGLVCVDCDAEFSATVTEQSPPGIAATTCPHCGTTQEPLTR